MNRLLAIMILGGPLVVCGSGLGTAGYSVTVRNDLPQAVVFYAKGVGENSESAVAQGVRLSAGASYVDHWRDPNSRSGEYRATLWALDPQGRTVFCQRLTWADIQRESFEIKIRSGVVDCPAGAPSG
jgi:hypothetical protein